MTVRAALPILLLMTMLVGCALRLPVRHDAEELAGAVEQLRNPHFLKRRHRATAAVPKRIDKQAPWLATQFSARYAQVPATHAIRAVLEGRLVVFRVGEDAGDPKVSAPAHAKTIGDHLDAISAQTNWDYEIRDGSVHWVDMPTRVFKITVSQGEWQAQLGRNSSQGEASAFNDDNQYAFLDHKIDFWQELGESLKAVLGNYAFTAMPSVNSVAVTAPPDYLHRVEELVQHFNRSASQRVLVEMEIYLVDLSNSEQDTLDWSFVRNASNGVRALARQTAGTLLDGLTPFTLSLEDLSDGQYSGTRFIFNALEEQGATTVVSRPRLICLNNQVSELRLTRVTPYTSEVSYSTEQNIATSRLTPNVSTEEVVTGTTIYVLPTINGKAVNLNLSVNYTQINRFLTQSFGGDDTGVNVQLPEYDDTQFTLPIALNSGETMVLAGNPHTVSDAQHRGNRWSWLGRNRRNNKRRTETVMLLTVHVLDPA